MDELIELKNFLSEKNYVSPWIKLDKFDFDMLINISPVISIKKGTILFHQGEKNKYIYIIRKGRMRLFYIDSTGNENCIYIAEEGSMIGEVSAISDQQNHASAYAIVDTTLYKVGYNDFLRVVKNNQTISIEIMKTICQKVRLMSSEIEYYSKPALSRVAITLISLCIQYGQLHNKGIKISIRFTHEELANLTSLNRVTVSKIYKKLFDEKTIYNENGYIIVMDVDKLKNEID